jgi:hypothetical protein
MSEGPFLKHPLIQFRCSKVEVTKYGGREPFCEHPFPVKQNRRHEKNEHLKKKIELRHLDHEWAIHQGLRHQDVQPGPTGTPGPSRQTRVLSGAAAERRRGKKFARRASRHDMDNSNSDRDVPVSMYSIKDAEFCTDRGVKTISLLSPNAVQQVSQTLARIPSTVEQPFPVLMRYFMAKEKDFRAIYADL